MEQAKPALLEPVMHVEIEAPDECAGAIMGDLNSRRGRVQGMETAGIAPLFAPWFPWQKMLSYGPDAYLHDTRTRQLRMEMDHYDFVPTAIAEKIAASCETSRLATTRKTKANPSIPKIRVDHGNL